MKLTLCTEVQEDNGNAYRSPELKVSFKSIFQECLARAKEHFLAKAVEPTEAVEEVPEEVPAAPEDPRAGSLICSKGPQLPGATVGAVGGDSGSESEVETGPRGEGEEREGVDLKFVDPMRSGREEWMTMAPDSMAGLFLDGNGTVRQRKADAFAVKRSKQDNRATHACLRRTSQEEEAFEKAFKERGPSLLSQQQDGTFAEAKEAQDSLRKRKASA
eukprot:s3055_g3.t1